MNHKMMRVATLLAIVILLWSDLHEAHAATFTVTNLDDSGVGSLRQAIEDANASDGADTITFAPDVAGVITLASALPVITDELTIEGPGAEVLAVSGGGLYRIFTANAGPVTISGLTLRDGYAAGSTGDGGAIDAHAPNYYEHPVDVNLHDVVVYNCRADRHGGGIFLYYGLLEISSSTINSNAAAQNGGGLFVSADPGKYVDLVISGSDLFGNTAGGQGGGFYANTERLTVDLRPGVELHHNQAGNAGGGARIESPGGFTTRLVVTAVGTMVHDNEATTDGGGLSIAAGDLITATLSDLDISNNQAGYRGGGLSITRMACEGDASVELRTTEIYSNAAGIASGGYGGGLYLAICGPSTVAVTESEIHHNTVHLDGSGLGPSYGGGVAILGEGIAVFNSTHVTANVAALSGGGIYAVNGTLLTTDGSIGSNASGGNGGGVSLTGATAFFTSTLIQTNAAAGNGGALQVEGNVKTSVVDSCIVGNSDTAVVNNGYGPQPLYATENWWGSPDGPSGVGPGSGDSVSEGVDFADFKTVPPPHCQPIIDMAKMAAGIPKPDDVVTYTLILSNSGLIADNAVRITDTLPLQTAFLDWLERPDGANVAGGRLTWTGAVAPTSVMTFSLRTTYGGSYSAVVTNTVDFAGTYTTGQRSAAFQAQHLLTVIKDGAGSGDISSAPGGIVCGGDCTEPFVPATVVTLTAAPQAGSVFIGWTGACSGANPICTMVMDASKATTATFSVLHDLTVQKNGDGDGVLSLSPPTPAAICDAGCPEITRTYLHNEIVTISASAATNSVFTGWTGACIGLNPCQITVDGDKMVVATFRQLQPLTVHKTGNGSGSVDSTPAGIGCGTVCTAFFTPETVVTLTATADISSTFDGWSGACASVGDVCVATMQAATDVTATFTLKQWPLVAGKTGGGQGNVNLEPPNVDCAAACDSITQTYDHGAVVTLTATAAPGFAFGGWLDDCATAGNNPVCNIVMTTLRSVTARFLSAYHLTVGKEGNGSGQVRSNDGGINCGTACSADYVAGTVVTLNAQADTGSNFAGWYGDCATANPNPNCQIAIDAAKGITATFDLNRYVLRLTKAGGGVVNLDPPAADCGADCIVLEETYIHGTVVTLTAHADSSFVFSGWGDACAGFGVNPICTVTMDGAKDVAANFDTRTFQLQINKTGAGRVSGGPPGGTPAIDCGATCQQIYDYGASVTLHAEPSTGQVFVGWDGACTGAAPSVCVVTMDSPREVTATFGAHGGLAGTVAITGTSPAKVLITAERLTPSGWQWVADTWVNLDGVAVSVGEDASTLSAVTASAPYSLTNLPSGAYRVRFGDLKDNYQSEYYDGVPFNRPNMATTVHVAIDSTVESIDATLNPAVTALAVITTGAGNVNVDPNTGQAIVVQPRPNVADVLVQYSPRCPPGSGDPTDVALRYGERDFPMTAYPPGSGAYVGVIPGVSVEDNTVVAVSFNCRGFPTFTVALGSVQLYDPSGVVTDATTDQPVQGAQVVLFRVPGWRPDASGETRECRTVDTRSGDTWENEPAADVHLGAALNSTIDADRINPDVNPQRTDAAGRYGWDVAEGCYYVLVAAAGYEERISPIVGVPPAVTDLDLKLMPLVAPQHSIFLPVISR